MTAQATFRLGSGATRSIVSMMNATTEIDIATHEAPPAKRFRGANRVQAAVAALFGAPDVRAFTVRYANGAEELGAPGAGAPFTLVLRRPAALRRLLVHNAELVLAESFIAGDIAIEGDLEAATSLGSAALRVGGWRGHLHLARALLALPSNQKPPSTPERTKQLAGQIAGQLAGQRHTPARDADAIRSHYDVGNEFYALWLDDNMAYSCGYFATGTETLDAAQTAKFDHICRKLRLQPGERLLDIGCGWGGLIRFAVQHYGVTAVGITLSPAQAAFAQQRIVRDGLTDRCRVELRDYRDMTGTALLDIVVSLGMFEHVGSERLRVYFDAAFRLTAPGGLFLNHGIVSLADARIGTATAFLTRLAQRFWHRPTFIDRYVFPDSDVVTLAVAARHAEAAGFETRDVESLREHYARTLRLWVQRLERRRHEAVAAAGERNYRIWRLYMAAAAHAFATARIGVAQMLFAKPDAGGRCCLPSTRQHIYGTDGATSARTRNPDNLMRISR